MSRLMMLPLLLFAAAAGHAEETEKLAADANERTTKAAGEYRFFLSESDSVPLKFHSNSLLRWSNPVIGEIHGNVFVWSHGGRPEVIGSLLQWYSPHKHGTHEFHSLSSNPVRGYRGETEIWTTDKPGLQFIQLPKQSMVADTRPLRLRQMRAIASGFRITSTDPEGSAYDLRLLTQPVFRYADDKEQISDGAIFTFVQGTDPEVFLLIEARREADAATWHVALAQMANLDFVARFGEQEVWRIERVPYAQIMRARDPYAIIRIRPKPAGDPF